MDCTELRAPLDTTPRLRSIRCVRFLNERHGAGPEDAKQNRASRRERYAMKEEGCETAGAGKARR